MVVQKRVHIGLLQTGRFPSCLVHEIENAEEKSRLTAPPSAVSTIAVGTGKKDKDGEVIPFNVKQGDKVLLPSYGGTTVKIDGTEYILVDEEGDAYSSQTNRVLRLHT